MIIKIDALKQNKMWSGVMQIILDFFKSPQCGRNKMIDKSTLLYPNFLLCLIFFCFCSLIIVSSRCHQLKNKPQTQKLMEGSNNVKSTCRQLFECTCTQVNEMKNKYFWCLSDKTVLYILIKALTIEWRSLTKVCIMPTPCWWISSPLD